MGQKKGLSFINYAEEDGLCDNQVSTIAQDSRGFIWIGTQGGFNRFDGFGFKKFYPTELTKNLQMTDNTAVHFECKPNSLLVRLGNSAAYTFNTVSQKLSRIESLRNVFVYDFLRINKETIAASSMDCCYLLDNNLSILSKITPPLKNQGYLVNIRKISTDQYLVFTSKEYFEYKLSNSTFKRINIKIQLSENYNSGFNGLYVDTKQKSFFVSNYFTGMYRVDLQGNVLNTWPNGIFKNCVTASPNRIIPERNNDSIVWISGNSGISSLNLNTNETSNYYTTSMDAFSLPGDYSSNVFQDRNNNLWVSTQFGVSCQNRFPDILTSWNLGTSSQNPLMNLIKTKNGEIYTSQYFGGIYNIDSNNGQYTQIANGSLNGSWFVFENGDYLVQGGKGTDIVNYNLTTGRIDKQSLLTSFFPNSTLVVLGYKCKNGDIWFSGNAGGGLVRIRNNNVGIVHYSKSRKSFSGSYFTVCTEDKDGDLWFSSNKSQILLHWKSKEEVFEEIDFEKKFKELNYYQSVIHCHTPDNQGNIWLGFDGSGLVKYEIKTGKISIFTKNQGLPHNIIYNLVLDRSNRLWLGTKKGLACLTANEKSILNFNLKNGFPTETFETNCSYYDLEKNQIWIASNDMLLRFNPDKLLAGKKEKLKVFIDEFKVNNNNRYQENFNRYRLRHTENNLQISFSALNFQRTNEVMFSYQFSSSNDDWINSGNNKNISLVNIPFGEYKFNLRAKLVGDINWTYLSKPVYIKIQTPWYRSWWFLTIVALATIFIVYVLIRSYFVRKIEKHKANIEKQKAVQEERDRIAYDMHDDLGSGLTKISYLSQMAIAKKDKEEDLTKINRTSKELVENMSELIWAMKVENDSLQDLLTYLKLYAVEYLEFNSIKLELKLPDVLNEISITGDARRNIFLLFKEALHNIVKHADATKVKISIELQPKFNLTIADNGKGFNLNEKVDGQGNGLRNMRKRTEKLNGTLEIVTKKGTLLTFSFPYASLQ